MTWLLAVLVVAVLGGVALVAAGRLDASLPPAYDDRPGVALPDGPLTSETLRRVHLPLAVRGYRMEEVDALLARLADQLEGDASGDHGGPQPG
jgi:DivIVA domain-containing protein